MFIKPTNDYAFKSLFKKEHSILNHFLNAALGKDNIQILDFLDPTLSPEIASKKESILDVLCKGNNHEKYIIEMQVKRQPGFVKRAQYYAAKAYGNQLDKSMNYPDLKEIIFIAITDFTMFPNKDVYKSEHGIFDKETFKNDLQDFSFVFLELPKFKKSLLELSTPLERWMYFFKSAHNMTFDEKKSFVDAEPIFEVAFSILDRIRLDEDELQYYEDAERKEKDMQNRMNLYRQAVTKSLENIGKKPDEIEKILLDVENILQE